MQTRFSLLGIVLLLVTSWPGGLAAGAESVTLPNCLVSLIEEAQVPAEEPGVLVELTVREGQQVATGDLLARIDDDLAQMQHKVAKLKLNVANEQANNDVNVRYARAAAGVARTSYARRVDADRKMPGAVPQQEMQEYYLNWQKLKLQIEQSELDLRVAGLEAQVSQAEVEAAQDNIDRRRIKAPLDGMVVKVNVHAGEWVQPGDPLLHLVRVDRLRMEGFLRTADYMPSQIKDRPVTVEVELAGTQRARFEGKVVFVSPLVDAGSEFRIWAEVANRKENDFWLLRSGLSAKMTIRLQ